MTDQKMSENLRNTATQHGGQMFFQIAPGANLKFPGALQEVKFEKDGSFAEPKLIIFCTLSRPYVWQRWNGW